MQFTVDKVVFFPCDLLLFKFILSLYLKVVVQAFHVPRKHTTYRQNREQQGDEKNKRSMTSRTTCSHHEELFYDEPSD